MFLIFLTFLDILNVSLFPKTQTWNFNIGTCRREWISTYKRRQRKDIRQSLQIRRLRGRVLRNKERQVYIFYLCEDFQKFVLFSLKFHTNLLKSSPSLSAPAANTEVCNPTLGYLGIDLLSPKYVYCRLSRKLVHTTSKACYS